MDPDWRHKVVKTIDEDTSPLRHAMVAQIRVPYGQTCSNNQQRDNIQLDNDDELVSSDDPFKKVLTSTREDCLLWVDLIPNEILASIKRRLPFDLAFLSFEDLPLL